MSVADAYNLIEFRELGSSGSAEAGADPVTPPPTIFLEEQDAHDIIEALLCIRQEEKAKADAAYRKVKDIERALKRFIIDNNVKLPLHTGFGTIHKGYANDRYRNPKRFTLRARRNLIGRKKRIVVDAA